MAEPEWDDLFLSAYDVPPTAPEEAAKATIHGGQMRLEGIVKEYFSGMFGADADKYPIPIAFVSDQNQGNDVRTHIMSLATGTLAQRKKAGRELARRLAGRTPASAHNGALVIMVGHKGTKARIAMWRFTVGESLRFVEAKSKVDEDSDVELRIDPKTFTKQSNNFKMAMWEDGKAATGFWSGNVKDHQVHLRAADYAQYWVEDFLHAVAEVNGIRGTEFLARGIKKTLKQVRSNDEQRENLIAAGKLVQTQKAKNISLNSFAEQLLPETRPLFLKNAGPPQVHESSFQITKDVISKRMGKRRVTVDKEIQISAPADVFEKRVKLGQPDAQGVQDITIRGKITSMDFPPAE